MSLTIPTDSLNKFVATASLIALLALLNISITNYERAELSRIDAFKSVLKYKNSCEEFCDEVEKISKDFMILDKRLNELKREKIKDTTFLTEQDEIQQKNKEIISRLEKIKPLERKAVDLKIDTDIAIEKMNFYYHMRNVWLGISVFLCLFFILTAYFGFVSWHKSENKNDI